MNTTQITPQDYQAAYANGLSLDQFHRLIFVHKLSVDEAINKIIK